MAVHIRAGALGSEFREWRKRRQLTQMDLAYMAGLSTRHLSFVETGRSKPSREMLLNLSEHLEIPLRERNDLLLLAGYAPVYPERDLANAELVPIRNALQRVLDGHEPYPALIFDRRYDVVALNRSVSVLLEGVSPWLLEPAMNVIRLALHPEGLAPRITNLAAFGSHLLVRLRREVARGTDDSLAALLDEVQAYPGAQNQHSEHDLANDIATPLTLQTSAGELSLFNTIATFGTARDVTVSELCIESFFPADAQTADALRARILPPRPTTAGPGAAVIPLDAFRGEW